MGSWKNKPVFPLKYFFIEQVNIRFFLCKFAMSYLTNLNVLL